MVTPQYFWKAVCHPNVGSIVFVMTNNVGDVSNSKIKGCNGYDQTSRRGIIECFDLTTAKSNSNYNAFQLPDFDATTCKTTVRGNFLDALLKAKLQ